MGKRNTRHVHKIIEHFQLSATVVTCSWQCNCNVTFIWFRSGRQSVCIWFSTRNFLDLNWSGIWCLKTYLQKRGSHNGRVIAFWPKIGYASNSIKVHRLMIKPQKENRLAVCLLSLNKPTMTKRLCKRSESWIYCYDIETKIQSSLAFGKGSTSRKSTPFSIQYQNDAHGFFRYQ